MQSINNATWWTEQSFVGDEEQSLPQLPLPQIPLTGYEYVDDADDIAALSLEEDLAASAASATSPVASKQSKHTSLLDDDDVPAFFVKQPSNNSFASFVSPTGGSSSAPKTAFAASSKEANPFYDDLLQRESSASPAALNPFLDSNPPSRTTPNPFDSDDDTWARAAAQPPQPQANPFYLDWPPTAELDLPQASPIDAKQQQEHQHQQFYQQQQSLLD